MLLIDSPCFHKSAWAFVNFFVRHFAPQGRLMKGSCWVLPRVSPRIAQHFIRLVGFATHDKAVNVRLSSLKLVHNYMVVLASSFNREFK